MDKNINRRINDKINILRSKNGEVPNLEKLTKELEQLILDNFSFDGNSVNQAKRIAQKFIQMNIENVINELKEGKE